MTDNTQNIINFRSPTAKVPQDLFYEHNQTEQAQAFLSPVAEQPLWYHDMEGADEHLLGTHKVLVHLDRSAHRRGR